MRSLLLVFCLVGIALCSRWDDDDCNDGFHVDIDTSDDALLNAGRDYGRIVFSEPSGVVTPRTFGELQEAVVYANCLGLTIATQGATHSTLGQAQTDSNGIAINMTLLNDMYFDDDDTVWVGAGTRWSDLLRASLARGLTPPVFTDYIELTVGGTLSVGGIGSQTFREGLQVDNVEELIVVPHDGRLVRCSPDDDSDLFYGVLAGYGQFGIIAAAKIPLVEAKLMTKYVKLLYADFDDFQDDLFVLVNDGRFDGVQGFAFGNNDEDLAAGSGNAFPNAELPIGDNAWLYVIEGTAYYNGFINQGDDDDHRHHDDDDDRRDVFARGSDDDDRHGGDDDDRHGGDDDDRHGGDDDDRHGGDDDDDQNQTDEPDVEDLIDGLKHIDYGVSDITYEEYIDRLAALEAFLRSIGVWTLPHPKVDLYVPRSSVNFIQDELETNFPPDVAGGIVLIYPCLAEQFTTPNYIIPNDDEFLLFAILRTTIPDFVDQFLAENAELYDRTVAVGGTGYAIDSFPLTPAGWAAHLGDRYEELEDLKDTYDPNRLFSPGQGMF